MPELPQGSGQGAFSSYKDYINKNSQKKSKTKLIGFLAVLLLVVTIPITVFVSWFSQDIRQRAALEPFNIAQYTSCGNAPADIVLIMDRSGSMSRTLGSGSTKIAAAKTAAKKFVDLIAADTSVQNRISLVTFSDSATINNELTNNFSTIKTKIDQLNPNGSTCTQCGVLKANEEISARGRANVKKVVILLTDGIANTIQGSGGTNPTPTPTSFPFPSFPVFPFSSSNPDGVSSTQAQVPASQAEAAAINAVKDGFSASKTTFFTIGLGVRNSTGQDGINEPFLQEIANITGGKYYYSPSTNDLDQIYQSISQIVGKGSITGKVFHDANNNKILDSGEQKLANWTVNLKDQTNSNDIATTKSEADGSYIFTGLCDKTYAVSETVQNGWTQTVPKNPNYYLVSITGGSVITDKHFGNTQNICGLTCQTDNDCSQGGDGCNYCNPSTKTCVVKPTPTPTACVTPLPVKNVEITCLNCPTGQP